MPRISHGEGAPARQRPRWPRPAGASAPRLALCPLVGSPASPRGGTGRLEAPAPVLPSCRLIQRRLPSSPREDPAKRPLACDHVGRGQMRGVSSGSFVILCPEGTGGSLGNPVSSLPALLGQGKLQTLLYAHTVLYRAQEPPLPVTSITLQTHRRTCTPTNTHAHTCKHTHAHTRQTCTHRDQHGGC